MASVKDISTVSGTNDEQPRSRGEAAQQQPPDPGIRHAGAMSARVTFEGGIPQIDAAARLPECDRIARRKRVVDGLVEKPFFVPFPR
jgi:hypothetical protein